MFYGSGAGKLPTASAVVGDVVDCAKHLHENIMLGWSSKELELMDRKDTTHRFFVRVKGSVSENLEQAEALFGPVSLVEAEVAGEFGFVTELMSEGDFEEKAEKLPGMISRIRVRA